MIEQYKAGDKQTSGDVLLSMLYDAVGMDNPMTPEALALAEVEVGMRLDSARDLIINPTSEVTGPIDSQARRALVLLAIERGELRRSGSLEE
jgi:hypothetical protein